MMKQLKYRIGVLLLFLGTTVLGSMHAVADTIPGRWELVESLAAGTPITVKSFASDPVQGPYLRLEPEYLVLGETSNSEIRILRNQVIEVVRLKQQRSWKPTKIGIVAGLAAGLTIGFAAGNDGIFDGKSAGWNGLILGGIGAGAGALVGAAIETAHQRPVVIYKAVQK